MLVVVVSVWRGVLAEDCCGCCFSLELPLLGQMLFQIVATLLPLLLQMPRQVSDIINYMVVDNR